MCKDYFLDYVAIFYFTVSYSPRANLVIGYSHKSNIVKEKRTFLTCFNKMLYEIYCQAQGPLSRPGYVLDNFTKSQERTLR